METNTKIREEWRVPVKLILPLSEGASEIKRRAWFQNTRVYFRPSSAAATQRQLFFRPVSLCLHRPIVSTPCPSAISKASQSLFQTFTIRAGFPNGQFTPQFRCIYCTWVHYRYIHKNSRCGDQHSEYRLPEKSFLGSVTSFHSYQANAGIYFHALMTEFIVIYTFRLISISVKIYLNSKQLDSVLWNTSDLTQIKQMRIECISIQMSLA